MKARSQPVRLPSRNSKKMPGQTEHHAGGLLKHGISSQENEPEERHPSSENTDDLDEV